MSALDAMIAAAAEARDHAHAPYSGFKVGACVRSRDGQLFVGCNVEIIAYPQGTCAEASAIGAMVAAGVREIAEMVVLAEGDDLCTPCGGCRQRIAEFSAPDMVVHVASKEGVRASFTIGELLPHRFDFDPGSV